VKLLFDVLMLLILSELFRTTHIICTSFWRLQFPGIIIVKWTRIRKVELNISGWRCLGSSREDCFLFSLGPSLLPHDTYFALRIPNYPWVLQIWPSGSFHCTINSVHSRVIHTWGRIPQRKSRAKRRSVPTQNKIHKILVYIHILWMFTNRHSVAIKETLCRGNGRQLLLNYFSVLYVFIGNDLAQERDSWRTLLYVVMNFRFHKMQGTAWRAENRLPSQEGLYFMKKLSK
jgi:hypothetical protein